MLQVEQHGAAAGEQQQYADGVMADEEMEVSNQKMKDGKLTIQMTCIMHASES